METIVITCGACRQDFTFRHPSVRSAADMARVTIDCTHCGTALTAAPNHIVMQPLQLTEFMERRLAQIARGVEDQSRLTPPGRLDSLVTRRTSQSEEGRD